MKTQEEIFKTISVSKIREFVSCQKRFEYKYVQGLEARTYQRPLEFGSIGHKFLELWYKSLKDNTVYDAMAVAEQIKLARGFDGFDAYSLQQFETDVFTACGMIEAYIQHYKTDIENYEILLIEEMVNYETEINGIRLRGVPDLILKEKKSNFVWVVDHKFLAQITEGMVKKLPLDYQVHAYLKMVKPWLEKNHPTLFLRGVIYNIVRKPSKRLKKDQTLSEYQKELFEDYLLRPSEFFYREMPIVTPQLMQNFDGFLDIITMDIKEKVASGKFLQNIFACDNYGQCAFLDLCLYGNASRHLYKETERDVK